MALTAVAGGIIPARAGFTSVTGSDSWPAGDHPRSRGVYAWYYAVDENGVGSSPLARGLLASSSIPEAASGIIPARAGFTSGRCRSRTPATDHPRSRGVYHHGRDTLVAQGGSSPLARGLRPEPRVGQLLQRIIPARAGFTIQDISSRSSRSDHPRSRGVYPQRLDAASLIVGSSPLARGLRRGECAARSAAGIIPARAGFTFPTPFQAHPVKDHPRSRGVYSTPAFPASKNGGSSPLARGLRRALAGRLRREGIIPARAGFTRQDIPRLLGNDGSSPLARGLHLAIGVIPTVGHPTRGRSPSLVT
mgnify:CR=1 FL=1